MENVLGTRYGPERARFLWF